MSEQKHIPLVHLIAGARPNFMKIAPLYHALNECQDWLRVEIVHTGQHYDPMMSDTFFAEFNLPKPHHSLNVGSASHSKQTADIMVAYENVCLGHRPDLVIVVGDVNSTIACALVAKKLHITLAHLEAGLRSGDRTMPEEINRLATDAITDVFWTPSEDADETLLRENHPKDSVKCVGNIMLDSFEMVRAKIEASDRPISSGEYCVVTLHRPSNVDDSTILGGIVDQLVDISKQYDLVFPVHPRTKGNLEKFDLWKTIEAAHSIHCIEPLGYIDFMGQVIRAKFVITDSGGIQEETTYLGIPCITVRDNTERPITLSQGTNQLCRPDEIKGLVAKISQGDWKTGSRPKFWDGKTSKRIVDHMRSLDL